MTSVSMGCGGGAAPHHVVQRVAGQVEADGGQFLVQQVDLAPGLGLLQARTARGRIAAEQGVLPALAVGGDALAVGDQHVGRGEDLGAVLVEAVEGPGPGQVFDRPLVDQLGIDPLDEIEDVAERPALLADGDQVLHGFQADVAHRAQGVQHLAVLDLEVGARAVDVRRRTVMSNRRASWWKTASLSVFDKSRLIDAARNSTGVLAFSQAV
jgi:hypothetical protein